MGCLSAKSDTTQDNLTFPIPNDGESQSKVQESTENKASMVVSVTTKEPELPDSDVIKRFKTFNVADTKVYLHINVLGS